MKQGKNMWNVLENHMEVFRGFSEGSHDAPKALAVLRCFGDAGDISRDTKVTGTRPERDRGGGM